MVSGLGWDTVLGLAFGDPFTGMYLYMGSARGLSTVLIGPPREEQKDEPAIWRSEQEWAYVVLNMEDPYPS